MTKTTDAYARTLPHNLEAERSVLGAILIDNRVLFAATSALKPQDFFRKAHRLIYEALLDLSEQGVELDLVTLKERLEEKGELEESGGPAYCASLVDGVPRSTNVGHYAQIVKEKAMLREVILIANKILAMAYEPDGPIETVLQKAEELFFDLRGDRVQGELVPARTGVRDVVKDLEWLDQHPGELTGVPTGFVKVDEMTHGLQRGDLIIVAGRPSMGKTSLMLDLAKAMAARGPVAFFSMEMRRKQLDRRLLANVSKVDLARILKGGAHLGALDWKALTEAMEVIAEYPIYIDDTPARTVWDIRSACRQMKAEVGLAGVEIDYVQLMGTADDRRRRGDTRTQELSDISRRLKILAGELDVPIVVASQLVRLEPNERPQLHHLRESGSLEQDADVVMLLYGPKGHHASGLREVNFAKQRNGPTGVVHLEMLREIVRFFDAPDKPAEPEPEAKPKPAKSKRTKSPDRW